MVDVDVGAVLVGELDDVVVAAPRVVVEHAGGSVDVVVVVSTVVVGASTVVVGADVVVATAVVEVVDVVEVVEVVGGGSGRGASGTACARNCRR